MNAEDFFICSHCGAEVPLKSSICKNCGSEDTTGWTEEADPFASAPPESFDYEEALENEFTSEEKKKALPGWVAITGFALLFLFIYVLIR